MLNADLAEPVQVFGEDYALTRIGRSGFALYGPYEAVPTGRHSVEFALALAEGANAASDMVCARLDVSAHDGRTLYNRRDVTPADLTSDPTGFTLDFDSATDARFEFRVWTTGTTPLLIRRRRLLREREADGAPAARWFPNAERRPNPMVLVDHFEDLRALHARGGEVRYLTEQSLEIRLGDKACRVRNYDELVACAQTLWPESPDAAHHGMPNYWEKRALAARDRRERFASFGDKAIGLVARTSDGLFVVDPEDGGVGASLLNAGSYGGEELAWAKAFLSAQADALIVGTHVGALLVPLARACRTLVGIEANPATFDLLRMNLSLNACANVTVHNLAAADKSGRLAFLSSRDNSGGSKIVPFSREEYFVYDDPAIIEVEARPLDEFLADRSFDFILMDIEGSEYFALRGMTRLLRAASTLVIEFMPHHLRQVANVTIDQFAGAITPFFDWMVVPATSRIFSADRIMAELQRMDAAGEGHDGLYFLKSRALEDMDAGLRAGLLPAD